MKLRLIGRLFGIFGILVVGILVGATAGIAAPEGAPLLAPVGTVFTYQGLLEDQGLPASGLYDFQFILHDHATNASPVGSPQIVDNVVVTEGLFMVDLDFGSAIDGRALWLQIEVRDGASSGTYTDLSPRQPLNPVPYAIHADKLDGYDAGTQTRYLSIPAAAFQSSQYDGQWDNHGSELLVWTVSITPYVIAPVYLPHGSEVVDVTFYWDDTKNPENGSISLRRVTMTDASYVDMANVSTLGSSGYGNATDSSIDYSMIDNTQYSYYIWGWLPFEEIKLISVLIEYTQVGLQ